MPDPKDGQAQQEQPAAEKKPTFDELYSKGWDEIEKDGEPAKQQAKEPEKTPVQKLQEEPECPDCPGGKPYKVIKHNGKDVIIKTEKEYNDYAQMGFDYTKKTQAIAEDRRKLESERESEKMEYQKLRERLERLEKGSPVREDGDNGKAKPAAREVTPQDEEAKVFEEYGLDPEYASDFEKKLVRDVAHMKKETQGAKEITQMIVLRDITKNITNALADAVKEFPVDEVTDDKGDSVTGQQVILNFKEIVANPANQKTPVAELAKMAVKRVYDAQQAAKGATSIQDEEMTVEDFAKKFPKLYDKILKAGGREAVTEFLEDRDGLPPTITPRKANVPATEQKGKRQFKGLSEAIDAGMEDPELKALFGG